MPRRYSAYLLRRWQLADGRERVEVQTLPSGELRRCRSLAEAYAWLQRRGSEANPPDRPHAAEAPTVAPDGGAQDDPQ